MDRPLSTLSACLILLGSTSTAQEPVDPVGQVRQWFVGPDARAQAAGTEADPFRLEAGLERLALEAPGLRQAAGEGGAGGLRLTLLGGRYRFETPFVLDGRLAGTADSPIVIAAAEGQEVVFDGAVPIDIERFEPVTDEAERLRLAPSAVDRVLVQSLNQPAAIRRLEQQLMVGLTVNGRTYLPARFPNEGFAKLAPEPVAGEASPPAVPLGKEDYGVRAGHPPYQEEGRARGWLGSLDDPRGAQVGIGERGDEMAGSWAQWQDEIARNPGRQRLTGYLDANWLQRSQLLVSADAATQSLRLSQALAYGWGWKQADKPFQVIGLLCELDQPGEWHYDPVTQRLYLFPPPSWTKASRVGVPVAEGFLQLRGARHVRLERLHVEHVAGGDVYRLDGSDNTLVGARIRNCTARGVRVTGRDNRVLGCDLVDLDRHVSLSGGRRGPGLLEAGRNLLENCHIYQRYLDHQRVQVSVTGVGNRLRNNLIHNSLGQAVTVRGNDHVLERNELFNIGFAEGDGGAIYAGGDLTGYGVLYRHNFIHHLMHVPGKVERSGIHLDDLQAGATCEGNLFYKSAAKGIFMNGGAGHVIEDNVFLAGYRGVYNVGHGSMASYQRQVAIRAEASSSERGSKEDYVGRAEAVVGAEGWKQEPWSRRYPLFREVMEDQGVFGRLWPIRCRVRGNLYWDHSQGNHSEWSRVAPEALAKSRLDGDRELSPEAFEDYGSLDLRFRSEQGGLPKIPFAEIGLYLDEARRQMPSKAHYRGETLRFFEGIRSMPGTLLRLDSGQLVDDGPIQRLR